MKARDYLLDHRLTHNERLIIQAYLLFRDGKYESLISEIENIEIFEPEVLAQKNLLLGLAFTNLTQYNYAQEFYTKAKEQFKSLKLSYYYTLTLINQFYMALIRFDKDQIDKIGQEILDVDIKTYERPERILRCLYHYYRINKDKKKSMRIHHLLEKRYESFSEPDKLNFLHDDFQKALLEKNYPQCHEVLNKLKTLKKYYSPENFKFMSKILASIEFKAPIYYQKEDFKRMPFLEEQIECLRSIEEGNIRKAQNHWHNLSIKMQNVFLKDFHFNGDDCLFKIALQRLLKNIPSEDKSFNLENLSVKDKIFTILSGYQTAVPQDLLFELVWGRPPKDKNDYQMISKALYKLKMEKNLTIEFHKKCYLLKAS